MLKLPAVLFCNLTRSLTLATIFRLYPQLFHSLMLPWILKAADTMSIQNRMMNNNNQKNNTSNLVTPQDLRQSRSRFLLFIRILFQHLKRSGDELLLEQAKLVVFQCRYNGSPQSLEKIVEQELHSLVGSTVFAKAKNYMAHYLKRQLQVEQQATNRPISVAKAAQQQHRLQNATRGSELLTMGSSTNFMGFYDSATLSELEPSPFFEAV